MNGNGELNQRGKTIQQSEDSNEDESELVCDELDYDFFGDSSEEEEEKEKAVKPECEFLKHLLEDNYLDDEDENPAAKNKEDEEDDFAEDIEGDYDFFND